MGSNILMVLWAVNISYLRLRSQNRRLDGKFVQEVN